MSSSERSLFFVSPPESCAAEYRTLCNPHDDRTVMVREHCESLWRDFADLADANFLDRLPFEFHQRWFEMYLGAALRRAGLEVAAPKPGPDFRVTVGGKRIHIEAIAPTAGNPLHADFVQEPVYTDAAGRPTAARVPHDQITLRIAAAFRAKADAFDRYRRDRHVGADETCIVAINLRDIPHAWADAEDYWFRAFYGVGDRFVAINPAGAPAIEGRDHRTLLHRASGAPEDVAPLLRAERAEIAGVLGSSADVGNVPNPTGDDFLLMPHKTPRSPYPRGFVNRGAEVVLHATESEHWGVEIIDYGAHQPRGPERVVAEYEGTRLEGNWSVAGRTLSVRIAGHGCDVPLAGGDDPVATAKRIAVEMLRAYEGDSAPAHEDATHPEIADE